MSADAFASFEDTINSLKHCKERTYGMEKIKHTSKTRSYSTGKQEKNDLWDSAGTRLMRGQVSSG